MCLVADSIPAFRSAAVAALDQPRPLDLAQIEAQHAQLAQRRERYGDCHDAIDIWRAQGIAEPERLPLLRGRRFSGGRGTEDRAMKLDELLDRLFPLGHAVAVEDQVFHGERKTAAGDVTVMGTTDHAEVGIEHALALAEAVLG